MDSTQRMRRRAAAAYSNEGALSMELTVPPHFRCPISLDLMKDPVTVSTGITYDRHSIEKWLEGGNRTCPVTNQPLDTGHDPIPNHTIRRMIQGWCVAHRSLGVERIPTPKTPLAPAQVAGLLAGISSASSGGEHSRCEELVGRLRAAAKESERNRRCVSSNGAGRVLTAAFAAFSLGRQRNNNLAGVLVEILAAMAVVSPLDQESCSCLVASDQAVRSLLWILKHGDLAGRVNAIAAIREVIASAAKTKSNVGVFVKAEGLVEALVDLIREPISPRATKAALAASFHLAASSREARRRFGELGAVHLLVEMLVDSDKSVSEKALGLLDGVCECEEGREGAWGDALAVPVLVKKMFRVSELATEFAVSALWKLCRARRGALAEALEAGAFQKLLVLLQVGCGQPVKVKATELLKLLNAYKGTLDCIEAADLRGLKRPL